LATRRVAGGGGQQGQDKFHGGRVPPTSRIADEAQGDEIPVSSLPNELTEGAGYVPFGGTRETEVKGPKGAQRVSGMLCEQS
jgi:hypothetical protein